MIAILMFNTEFLFRGYLLFSLKEELGKAPALVLHAIPYALVHLGKPTLEVPYSFFMGLFVFPAGPCFWRFPFCMDSG